MDSDLSLLEISEEDNTLLQQIPSDEMSRVNNYLSCSPLLRSAAPSRACSLIDCMKVDEHAAKASHSSPSYKFNKDNNDANKPEVSNLSNEPQQTKRRKKGGGYNLRKSIAWNRAFFTDEGVLDPSELSMISGAYNKSSGRALSIIQEEGNNSVCGDSDRDSLDLQPQEEHLLKELRGSTLNQGKVIGSCFSPKCGSSARDKGSPASAASRKVLSAHDVNRSGSKRGGYSRPLASSSHKRPANASTTKAVIKESKIPKIPVLKPAPRSLPATTKSATLNNKIAGRALDVQKNVGFKGSSNSRRNMERDIKSGPGFKSLSSKPSVQLFRKDRANSPRQMPLSSNLQSPQVAYLSSGLGLIPDPELQATATQASSAHDVSTNFAVPLRQNSKCTSENMQSVQLQARKPSSLRMPSPSLGFFGQPKASGSQSLLERDNLPCKIPDCGIPKLQKLGSIIPDHKLRPPRAPGKKLEVVNDLNTVRSLSAASTVPSFMNSVSQDNMKLNLQKVDEKVPENQLHSTFDDAVKQNQEHAEPSKIENFPCKGDKEMEVNDNKFLQSRSYDYLEKNDEHIIVTDVCMGSRDSRANEMENSKLQLGPTEQVLGVPQIKLMTEHQQAEDKKYNSSGEDHYVIAEAETQYDTGYSNQGVQGLSIRSTCVVDVQSEQDELTKSCFGEANQTSYEENQGTQTSDSILFQESRSSEVFQKIDIENVSLKVMDLSGNELERFNGLPQYREQANEASGIDIVTIKSHGVDAELQCLDYNLSVERGSRKLSTFAVDNQCLMVDGVNENSGEPSELQNPCLIKQDCHELHLSDFHGSKLNNSHLSSAVQVDDESRTNCSIGQLHREDHKYNLLINNNCVLSESQSGDVISSSGQVSLSKPNDCISGMCDVDEPCADQPELTEARTGGTDQIFQEKNQKLQASNDNLIEENRYFEEFWKDSTGNVADASPQIRSPRGSELNSSPSFQFKCVVQADEGAGTMYNMTEKSHLGGAIVQSLDVNQYVEDSADHHDCPMVFDDVNKHIGEHSELKNLCSSFDDSREENIQVHGNDEFVASKCSDASGSESKGADALSWVPPATQEGNVFNENQTRRFSRVENVREMSIETEALVEDQIYLADTQLRDAFQFNSEVTLTAENLKGFHSMCEESELLTQTLSGKADSNSYLNDSHERLQRNNGNLFEETRSFEEVQKDDREHITDARGSSGREPESSCGSSQPKYTEEANECASGVDNMARNSQKGDKEVQLLDYNVISESFQHNQNTSEVYNQLIGVANDAKEVSGELSKKSSETLCYSSKNSCLSNHTDQTLFHQSISGMKSKSMLEESETQNSTSSNSELANKLENVFPLVEHSDATIQLNKSGNDLKQDVLVIKPPPNAVPFSDEWLAAMEAAGEDILALKTGAVQHSPPDKSIAEPSPWSPVKRKNNQGIGPFDCTKYTNTSPSNSH